MKPMIWHRGMILCFLLWVLFASPAWAQKTTQKASKPQVITMVVFAAVTLKVLSYLRVP